MATAGPVAHLRRRFDAAFPAEDLPPRESLPWYVAPLPSWLEDLGLRLVWVVVAVNLVGTLFGFWFYRFQFSITDPLAWPVVPDSPVATLFIALSLASWRLGHAEKVPWLHALAFFGCIKLGAWTPFVLTVFPSEWPGGSLAALGLLGFVWEYGLYTFLVTSHLAMVVEAFLVHRYARLTVPAVAVATGWYLLNDVVDYLIPFRGSLHHTLLGAEPFTSLAAGPDHSVFAHDLAAAAAVTLTVAAVFLAIATRVAKLKLRTQETAD
jgi:uncharacterized membrane protein YpjA